VRLGLLAQRRLTNRFQLEFPSQFPAPRLFHRTPFRVSNALIEVSAKRGDLHFEPHTMHGWLAPDFIPFVLQDAIDNKYCELLTPAAGREGVE